MIKKIAILAVAFQLVGCATYAEFANSQDPCQSAGKPADYKKPSFCGASQRIPMENASNRLSLEYVQKSQMAMKAGQYSTACSYAKMNSNVTMNLNNQARYQSALNLEKQVCNFARNNPNRG
jgi:hypothetical protein